jgi:hypothetical protein
VQTVSYFHRFGIEMEGFTRALTAEGFGSVSGGRWDTDAGLNLVEAITDPMGSIAEAIEVLRALEISAGAQGVNFIPFRPLELMANSRQWQDKPRYHALREALRREQPLTWAGVDQMTDCAAFQVNASGRLDPFGEAGVYLINMFNEIAPYVAAVIHRETKLGRGHLQIWQHFAAAGRLPEWNRWFRTARHMQEHIEGLPRLFEQDKETGKFLIQPDVNQDINNPFDLGVTWWFLRPKRGNFGEYLELRFMPSMSPDLAERYAYVTVGMLEALLEWFEGDNQAHAVSTKEHGWRGAEALREVYPQYVPKSLSLAGMWQALLTA